MAARRAPQSALHIVEAIYEWQGTPLMFLIDADVLEDDPQLQRVRRLLAMRGDAPYLGVVEPGRLRVYRVALDNKTLQEARVTSVDQHGVASTLFPRLGNVRPEAGITNDGWISNVVLRLLSGSTRSLIEHHHVSHENAISLVGRALFTRFLADRSLLPEGMSEPGIADCLFDTCNEASQTSDWLDATFNGDLLPLSRGVFDSLHPRAYRVLGDVLRRAPDGQLFLGWEEKWGNLDFAHIPVGVLSQAYELYMREHAPSKQRREGGYFTPKPIAELMVRASFGALKRRATLKTARVLDPAVGGGIFLLTAFRELVAEHWRATGERPDTELLRRILYEQLAGFDINEAALQFAALGLYLLSIELDPNPRPVDKLRFKNLRGTVLHGVKVEDEAEEIALGSLGPLVGEEHRERYDLVIGNPPWSSSTKLPGWSHVRATVARIAADRGIRRPALPNEGLDLPFVWRALEWAKPDGQIAFALHGRLLFRQGDGMPTARAALFQALDVTSVINGVELRQTKVWPQISAPFCILFATNRDPGVEPGFRFVSPRLERSLNDAGGMRIDALNAEIVPSRQLLNTPELLKILFRGSRADLGILERIRAQQLPTLYDFWEAKIGVIHGRRLRGSGTGYQTLRRSSRVRQRGDGQPGVDATYLHGRREITVASFDSVSVDPSTLDVFLRRRIHDPRPLELFTGPQAIVYQSPPAASGRLGVVVSDDDVIFNQSFYGYSPVRHPQASLLARYLALVLGSKLALWFVLLLSGQFGFERDVVEKAAVDRIHVPDFDDLAPSQYRELAELFDGLQSRRGTWAEVDEWVADLYGLGTRDLRVILDTLECNLPFAENKRNAQAPPSAAERQRFCTVLRDELKPWCERFGTKVIVGEGAPEATAPWEAIGVGTGRGSVPETISAADWAALLSAADVSAATEILVDHMPNGLLIARLGQKRLSSNRYG